MTRVAVVFTGGTISMEPDPVAGGAVPVLRGADILARTDGLERIAEVEPIDWGLVPAAHLGFDQILALARLLEATLARDDVVGAVVVQGTDTIEETSFAFDLLLTSAKPVVVTGAMRNAAQPDYDGPRNLRDAVAVAAAPEVRGLGALVVMGGRIIGGDQAIKRHASAMDAFAARNGRPIGRVGNGYASIRSGRRRATLPAIPLAAAEPVFLVTAVTGMDGDLVRRLRALRPRGLVVAATGAGNTHPDLLAAARELMEDGATVCLTTRCRTGHAAPVYAFPGGGAEWHRAGALFSRLDGPKCRVGLALGLGAGLAAEALRRIVRA